MSFLSRILLFVLVFLCLPAVFGYAAPHYIYWHGNWTTPLMRSTLDDGEIYEYYDEIKVKGSGGQGGYGRLILAYDPNNNIQGETFAGYKIWDWDSRASTNQVVMQIYDGSYSPSSGVWSDIQPQEKRTEYIYDYNSANANWWQVNTAINGWVEREKRIYDTNGVTVRQEYLRDTAGRLIKSRNITADSDGCASYDYSYSALGNMSQKNGYVNNDWSNLKVTYTYYDNATNRMKIKSDLSESVYYVFADEPFNGVDDPTTPADERYGRTIREVHPVDSGFHKAHTYYTYTYHTSTGMAGVIHYKRVYNYNAADEAGIINGTITGTFDAEYEYINTDYMVGREGPLVNDRPTGATTTYLVETTGPNKGVSHNHTYITYTDPDPAKNGILLVYNWDSSWNIVNVKKYYQDGKIEICTPTTAQVNGTDPNPTWPLKEQILPPASGAFIKGVNLPWVFDNDSTPWSSYGYGLGLAPNGDHCGFSRNIAQLYKQMDNYKGEYVRIFLFADFRAALKLNPDGTPWVDGSGNYAFTDKVFEDMQALLDSARALGIKLMPVLFDFDIADGKDPNGKPVSVEGPGEFPSLITDPLKRQKLAKLFESFMAQFGNDPSVYAWDIMNEPEYASAAAITIADLQAFVGAFTGMIHNKAPGALVTVGSKDRTSMLNNWTGRGLDIYQFHYYDSMEGTDPLDYSFTEAELKLLDGAPVIAGELQPTNVSGKLDTLAKDGYAGGFFWQDESKYTISDPDYQLIQDWYYGTKYTYHSSSHRLESKTMSSPDLDTEGHNYYYHYLDESYYDHGTPSDPTDDYGRIDMVVKAAFGDDGAIGYTYIYSFDGPPEPYVYDFLPASDISEMRRAYGTVDYSDPANPVFGDLLFIYSYDSHDRMIQKMWADGHFEMTEYVGDSNTISFVHSYGHGWVWTGSLEYYNDATNRLKAKYCVPDASGNIYYEYLNEAFYNNGTPSDPTDDYGRVSKSRRIKADSDGCLSYDYSYFGDGNMNQKRGYSDSGFTTLVVTYNYYDNSTNRLKSKTLPSADIFGNTYYEYLDEPFYGTDDPGTPTIDERYGRTSKSRADAPDTDGCRSYTYTYSGSTDRVTQKDCYTNANWTTLKVTYGYFDNSTNRLQSKTLVSADTSGNNYYEYVDEPFYGTDNPLTARDEHYGRIYRQRSASTGDVVKRLDWYTGTEHAKKEEEYTDLTEATWVETRWFYDGATGTGRLSKKVNSTGEAAKYFDAGQTSSSDYKLDTYWSASGTVTHWASVADYNTYNHYKSQWYYDGSSFLEVYSYYASGRVQYKDIYQDVGGTWTWLAAGSYKDTGGDVAHGNPWGTWNDWVPQSTTGAPSTYTMPDKPARADALITSLQTESLVLKNPETLETANVADLLTATAVSYEYDGLGRVIKTIYDNGDYKTTSYFGAGQFKYQDITYAKGGVWQETLEYYEGSATIHYQWMADERPTIPGDILRCDYNSGGQVIQEVLDTGEFRQFEYWGVNQGMRFIYYYAADWTLQESIEFYNDLMGMRYHWIADPNPSQPGDVVRYDYDTQGRLIQQTLDTGDFIQTFYYGTTTNKQYDVSFAADWTWQKSIVYYEDGVTMHYQVFADAHPSTPGDEIKYEYDSTGRLIQKTLDTGDFIQTFYYGATTNKQYDVFFAADWTWQKSIVYYEDGITMHFQNIADAHPGVNGDVVYEEYDTKGACILKRYDDGSTWTPQSLNNNTLAMAEQNKEAAAVLDTKEIQLQQAQGVAGVYGYSGQLAATEPATATLEQANVLKQ